MTDDEDDDEIGRPTPASDALSVVCSWIALTAGLLFAFWAVLQAL